MSFRNMIRVTGVWVMLVLMGLLGVWQLGLMAWTLVHDGGILMFGQKTTGRVLRHEREWRDGQQRYRAIVAVETDAAPFEVGEQRRAPYLRYPVGASVAVALFPRNSSNGCLRSDLNLHWALLAQRGALAIVLLGVPLRVLFTRGGWRLPRRLQPFGARIEAAFARTPLGGLHWTFQPVAYHIVVPVVLVGGMGLVTLAGVVPAMFAQFFLAFFGHQTTGVVVDQHTQWQDVVVGSHRDSHGDFQTETANRECYYAIIALEPAELAYGPYHIMSDNYGIDGPMYATGSSIEVMYPPGHPEEGGVRSEMSWGAPIILGLFGLMCLGVAILVMIITGWVKISVQRKISDV